MMDQLGNRPESPGAQKSQTVSHNRADYDPEMAAAAMAREVVEKLGTPTIISKTFAVRYGLFSAINHTSDNKTYYDASLRLRAYEHVARDSVNIDGKYFERIWSYLMKPKYIIQGMPTSGNTFDQDNSPGFLSRVWGRLSGKPTQEPQGGQ